MLQAVNPYIAGSPVTGAEMFFGREDVFAFVREALVGRHRDNVIILYGERRTGKTSTLYQLPRHLDARYLCVLIDLHGLALEGLAGFLWELANSITRTLSRTYHLELAAPPRAAFATDPRDYFENEFLGRVWETVGDRQLLLMLDEAIRLQEQVRAGKLEQEIFEYLRHLMQHYTQLSFLFALGQGLEEMAQEYAFLFSVGLYKRISFLERDSAIALITQPVREFYRVEPAACERILEITAGHPYYTQLLCHGLFNHWLHARTPNVGVPDVDAILDEAVERGLAVLKHVWEESTPAEKAILAGAAVALGPANEPVSAEAITAALQRQHVIMPADEMARAYKSLLARELLDGPDPYRFTVDLQRRWIAKYERLEWVRDEIAATVRRWMLPPPPIPAPAVPAGKPPPPPRPQTWQSLPASKLVPPRRWPLLALLLGGAALITLLLVAWSSPARSNLQQAFLAASPTNTVPAVRRTLTRPTSTPAPSSTPTTLPPSPTVVFGAGVKILFTSGTPGCSKIGLLTLDTGAVTYFNPASNNEEPSWAPDGKHFVASTGDCYNDKYFLTLFDAATGTNSRLDTSCNKSIDANWGSDNRIYFACGPKADNGDLYVVNPDGSGLHTLGLTGRRPTLSPDGKRMTYMREEKSGWRIGVAEVRPDGTLVNLKGLPFPKVLGGVYARQPKWSSDGTHIFFNVTDQSTFQAMALASVELATNNINVTFITSGANTPYVRPACGRNNVCVAGGATSGLWLLQDVNGTLTPQRQLTFGDEFGADVYP